MPDYKIPQDRAVLEMQRLIANGKVYNLGPRLGFVGANMCRVVSAQGYYCERVIGHEGVHAWHTNLFGGVIRVFAARNAHEEDAPDNYFWEDEPHA